MKTTVLIIGATGKTGLPIVEQSLEAGLEVRALIRRVDERSARLEELGAQTVFGDVHDISSVRELVKGVDRIYFTYPPQLDRLTEATANVATAAKDAGIKCVVNMSQITVREDPRSDLTNQHWLSEQIFDHADVAAVHIRPTFFMENFLLFNAAGIASEGKIYLPYGSRGQAPIAAADIARVAVHLLGDPEPHKGERLILTGPELFTIPEIANLIGQQVGRPVEYVDLPAEQWRDILAQQLGFPQYLADHLYNVALDHQDGIFERRSDTVEKLTGTAPQRFADFVGEHLAQFKGEEAVFRGI